MSSPPFAGDENVIAVMALREQSRRALLERKFEERRTVYSSTYVAHTPDYTIVDTQGLIDALSSGRVSYDSSESVVEYAASHGPELVVVLGVETVVPSAGRPNAGKRVPRRFSDVYRKEDGVWRHDVRHAHIAIDDLARGVIPPSSPVRRISDDPRVSQVLDYRRHTLDSLAAGKTNDPTGNYSSTFIANTPLGRIVTGPEMRAIFAGGSIGYARVEQSFEYAAAHSSAVVVLMGGEIVVPRGDTRDAGKKLHRRFTDVFRREDGEWRHDLRHANVWNVE